VPKKRLTKDHGGGKEKKQLLRKAVRGMREKKDRWGVGGTGNLYERNLIPGYWGEKQNLIIRREK